ncbi:nicotinic acid mononucleotide adenyltransferase [Galbibacter sp. EGI 63066]|uniref:nicotinic acid mononucleotide adenyltransferase n=1 Tax=Galbibacter sp. EGI 63066 TaxID=2993559 RepID=UPI0022492D54|nr:nicotinic acid mononucleotide adenyltransferase [Galbibacter sp. EGI 63066]MCX2681300.1 nicotinic acid mononucleotide adenyltransferase [Galbibacter sp. EGI 63066]
MRIGKLLLGILMIGFITTSCSSDPYINDGAPAITLEELLTSYDLWYVNINDTQGSGEVPFLQTAFTLSFDYGLLMANNNLVGFGSTGNGLGINTGTYATYGSILEVDHDLDGFMQLEVIQHQQNYIEIYDSYTNTSYFLTGYQRQNFDYDYVFYENIEYFLQEYEAWEKTFTSNYGALNEFDEENFLTFIPEGYGDTFLSSVDPPSGTSVNNVVWDYEGIYGVYDVAGDPYLKTLTLDYDYMGNDYFELVVINDNKIELYHPDSGTVYEFTGRGYIQYLKGAENNDTKNSRKRTKVEREEMNIERQSPRGRPIVSR